MIDVTKPMQTESGKPVTYIGPRRTGRFGFRAKIEGDDLIRGFSQMGTPIYEAVEAIKNVPDTVTYRTAKLGYCNVQLGDLSNKTIDEARSLLNSSWDGIMRISRTSAGKVTAVQYFPKD